MSAHTSSMMFCRIYPQVTTSASRKVSSRGRPSPLFQGLSTSSPTRRSSSSSCTSVNPDIRSNRNGFSCWESFGMVTSFLSVGEAVALYLARRVEEIRENQARQCGDESIAGFRIIHQVEQFVTDGFVNLEKALPIGAGERCLDEL